MPLKEIAVNPAASGAKDPSIMEKMGLCDHGNDHGNSQGTAQSATNSQTDLPKDNSVSCMDGKDSTSEGQTDTGHGVQSPLSKDIQTVALFTASSEKKECEDCSSGVAQGTSRPSTLTRHSSTLSSASVLTTHASICRICHCEGDEESPLVTPCLCLGSLQHVHQACIQQWIKSSNTKSCELCRFPFIMQTKLKPVGKWEKLDMSMSERRKIICSVSFHVVAITCVVWALYVLIDHTTIELHSGNIMEWPFWTKLVVVAIGFTGGLVFMYIQCKVYLQLWRRLKAYNRVIYVQNCPPEERLKNKQTKTVPEPPQPQVQIIT